MIASFMLCLSMQVAGPDTSALAVQTTALGYTDTILVASDASYEPLALVDPLLSNGWGLAIRPPGAGGHFWVSNFNTGTTTTYVGDVHDESGNYTPLSQDYLLKVDIPRGAGLRVDGRPTADVPMVTGQVFNHSKTDFIVSGEGLTGASKFLFVTAEGTISGWTERKDPETGRMEFQTKTVIMVDQSHEYDDDRLRYTGCAVTDFPENNRLYVTNWWTDEVEVYDHQFKRVTIPKGAFRYPGQPDGFRAWNIQYFRTGPVEADGRRAGRLWTAVAMMEEPWEEDPSFGAVCEFDLEGNFIRRLAIALDTDPYADSELRAPWGLAIAPDNYGPLSNTMLVANFGDGSIAGFNLDSNKFVDFMRDDDGNVILIDGIWGILFGNGVGLGDTNAMYYAAGPNNEFDGTFGTLRYTPQTCPKIIEHPASITVLPSQPATLRVHAPSPVKLQYQWQRAGADGSWIDVSNTTDAAGAGTAIGGATSPELTIGQGAFAGTFRCVVRNRCGMVYSKEAIVQRNRE
jgi:uncharacterized protein (TIGR03118 family)